MYDARWPLLADLGPQVNEDQTWAARSNLCYDTKTDRGSETAFRELLCQHGLNRSKSRLRPHIEFLDANQRVGVGLESPLR
jgi:hypothetical protein